MTLADRQDAGRASEGNADDSTTDADRQDAAKVLQGNAAVSTTDADRPEADWGNKRKGKPDEPRIPQGDPESSQETRWLKVAEAASIAGTHRGVISKAVDDGRLKSNGKRRRARRIDALDLAHWMLKRSRRPEPGESDEEVERKIRQASRE
jgi:hypothetical protein